MATEENAAKPNPAWKIALVGVPVFLVLSGAFAMWSWWSSETERESEADPRLALAASEVHARELDDHLRKLTELIGRRGWDTPEGRRGLRQTIAFVRGTLSPQNYGFAVREGAGLSLHGELWPTLWIDLPGSERPDEVLLAAAPYDQEAAVLAAVLAAVNDLRDEPMARTVRFVFYPAALYAAEGTSVTAVLKAGESHRDVALPAMPEAAGPPTGEDLVPVSQALVAKVRDLARRD